MSDGYSSFRQKRGEDLCRFATALKSSNISCDVSSLTDAGGKCAGAKPEGRNSWGYNFDGLLLREPDNFKHVRPNGASLNVIQINVSLSGKCIVEDGSVQNHDPLLHLGVEIILNGEIKNAGAPVSLRSSWYMDRYDAVDDRITSGKNVKCPVHPSYHFQFGGKHIRTFNPGEMIVVNPPRIAHPPMDAILTVDFVISNYFSSHWLSLRENPEYLRLVKEAQCRFWLPYAQALIRNWGSPTQDGIWETSDLWPQVQH